MADDFLDEVFPDPVDPVEDAPIQEPQAEVEPAPETVEEPQPQVELPPVVEKQDHTVPLPKYLDTRDELKEAKRRLAEYESRQNQQQEVPDPWDNPEGYRQHVDQQVNAGLQKQKADMSYMLAVRDYGKDTVEAARTWALEKAQTDPMFGQQVETAFQAELLPVDWVVKQHQRDATIGKLGDKSLDDWFNEELARRNMTPQNAPAPAAIPAAIPQQAAPPVKVPRSLATQGAAPSDLRHVASGPLAGVDALFSA